MVVRICLSLELVRGFLEKGPLIFLSGNPFAWLGPAINY